MGGSLGREGQDNVRDLGFSNTDGSVGLLRNLVPWRGEDFMPRKKGGNYRGKWEKPGHGAEFPC